MRKTLLLFSLTALLFITGCKQEVQQEGLSERDIKMFQYMEAYLNQLREPRYQLFKTQNMWTFLKLDTRTGKIWQVQYSVDDDNFRGEIVLNDVLLITSGELKDGRFNLYPTQNIFNFILLDQIDGKMWQVQWSTEEENRGIISLNSK